MSKQSLSIEEFGWHLLWSGDLDPIYTMLTRAIDDRIISLEDLHIWCLAYWLDYNAGVACEAVEYCQGLGQRFWTFIKDVALNESRRWPRGSERRHFRGKNAWDLVKGLSGKYRDPSEFMSYVFGCPTLDFKMVAGRVQSHIGLGPWIAFKIADMGERVLGYNVNFVDCQMAVYKDPVKGARMMMEAKHPSFKGYPDKELLKLALEDLSQTFGHQNAPPYRLNESGDYDGRLCNIQEYETILCKWKSHMNGHYPLNKDTIEIRKTLEEFSNRACDCSPPRLAQKLAIYLPQVQA